MDSQLPWGKPALTEEHRLSFAGSGREYFGIWIVNILLTIVTLGIYSAWAKVRRMRYFLGNTMLMERGFEYHARPVQILIGRIIIFLFLAIYNAALNFFPLVGLFVALPIFLLAMPWFIKRGLRFRARVTSYRNVRFDFTGGYWGAFKVFILGGIITTFSLGILAPVVSRWSWRYLAGNLRYGGRAFATNPALKAMYKIWSVSAGILIVVTAAMVALVVLFQTYASDLPAGRALDLETIGIIAGLYLFVFGLLISYGVAGLYYAAGIRNVAMNAATFDGKHSFVSDLKPFRYAWIAISNLLATLLTIGLARPWAAVRMHRYVVEHTALVASGPADDYMATIEDEGSAAGAEFMDVEGIDLGF